MMNRIYIRDNNSVPYIEYSDFVADEKSGAVIICPGGGYCNRAKHEGVPVAEKYEEKGIKAFLLQYRVFPNLFPVPLNDLLCSISLIRNKAEDFNIQSDKIAVCGFSAGGHLCASSAVYFNSEFADSIYRGEKCRPDATILSYPVITGDDSYRHTGSLQKSFGDNFTENDKNIFSLEKHISSKTPPCFLWHTADDSCVPARNSTLFANSLEDYKIPFELHVFPKGRHGLGLADNTSAEVWHSLSVKWLKNIGW